MKILHIPDVHVGYTQYGLLQRRADFIDAFSYAVNLAITEQVHAVVFTGDLTEAVQETPSTLLTLQQGVNRLLNAGIVVLGIAGNHDSDKALMDLLSVTALEDNPQALGDIIIAGINNCKSTAFLEKASTIKADLLLTHQSLEEACPFGDTFPIALLDPVIKDSGIKYIAAGHIHNYSVHYTSTGVPWVYGGSLEMTDANEAPDKYCIMIDTDTWEHTPMKVPARRLSCYTLNDDKAVDDFLTNMRADDALITLVIEKRVSKRFSEIKRRAEELDVLVRKTTYVSELAGDLPEIAPWDAENCAIDLQAVVGQTFDKDSNNYALVNRILENPAEWRGILDKELEEPCM